MATTPTIDEFRAEVRAFLDANAERRPEATAFVWGEGSERAPTGPIGAPRIAAGGANRARRAAAGAPRQRR